MRKSISLIVFLAMLVSAAGCGSGGSEAPAAPSAASGGSNAANGDKLFHESILNGNAGCVTCHSLEPGKVLVGPSMAGIGARAGSAVSGQSAAEYLRASIVDPNAHLATGCNATDREAICAQGLMPQDWAEKLTEAQIGDLVAYMLTLK
jgi:cytochrome c551/c552